MGPFVIYRPTCLYRHGFYFFFYLFRRSIFMLPPCTESSQFVLAHAASLQAPHPSCLLVSSCVLPSRAPYSRCSPARASSSPSASAHDEGSGERRRGRGTAPSARFLGTALSPTVQEPNNPKMKIVPSYPR